MDPDKYQQAWQTQASQTRVTIAADLLRNEVQRNQKDFQLTILLRDIREVGVSLLMIPVWFFLGAMWSLPWSWYLTVLALVWVAGFILVDRMHARRQSCEPGGPLVESVQGSLAEVEHQIWLLRNIFWWYLLPPSISILAFFADVTWSAWVPSESWMDALVQAASFVVLCAVLFAVYGFIYFLNQYAVRRQLEPRRQELLALLASLKDETNGNGAPDRQRRDERVAAAAINRAASVERSRNPALTVSFIVLLAALTALASVAADYLGQVAAGTPKVSPFAAVRWEGSQPAVKIGEEWFTLVSIDDVPATQIVTFSQQTYGDLWQKRFEEDLVEVLAGMGHETKKTVRLVVMPLGSQEKRTLEDVRMTKANRRAIRAAAQIRENKQRSPAMQLAPEELEKYVGVYAISPQFALAVTLEGDQLMVQATGQQKFQLDPVTEDQFLCKGVDARLFFVADPTSGKFNYVVLHQNGVNQTGTRQD
jgi:hypothetical protein